MRATAENVLLLIARIIVILVLLTSCMQRERPEDILEREPLIDLMVDIQLAEAIYSGSYQTTDGSTLSYADIFNPVYDKHGVTRKDLEKSLKWYSRDIAEITAIYDAVIERLNRMEGNVIAEEEEEQPVGPDEMN